MKILSEVSGDEVSRRQSVRTREIQLHKVENRCGSWVFANLVRSIAYIAVACNEVWLYYVHYKISY